MCVDVEVSELNDDIVTSVRRAGVWLELARCSPMRE
jgi:hypothetical protein